METGQLVSVGDDHHLVLIQYQVKSDPMQSLDVGFTWQDLKEDIEGKSWESLRHAVFVAIAHLKYSSQSGLKSTYRTLASEIVRAVYRLFLASGTMCDWTSSARTNRMLKVHHRHIMKSMAKLVLYAKQASNVWPPPDAMSKMVQAANETLLAVRHFTTVAEESGMRLPGTANRSSGKESTKGALSRAISASPFHVFRSAQDYLEAVDRYQQSIENSMDSVRSHVCSTNPGQCSELILLTRQAVTEVGQFLTFIEEIPIHFTEEKPGDAMIDHLQQCRQNLYNNISGLVSATTATADALAPAYAMEHVAHCAKVVYHAVDELVLAAKHILAEQDTAEQVRMEYQLGSLAFQERRISELSVRPRRAISLTAAHKAEQEETASTKDESSSSPKLDGETPHSLSRGWSFLQRRSSALRKSIPVVERAHSQSLPSHAGVSVSPDTKALSKLLDVMISEESPAAIEEQKPWFLKHEYDPKNILTNGDGLLKGATLEVLVERLTAHDQFGRSFLSLALSLDSPLFPRYTDSKFMHAFLLTYRTYAKPDQVLQLLAERFQIQKPDGMTRDEQFLWTEKKLKPIRLRVINVLKSWIDSYLLDEEPIFFDLIEEFASTRVRKHMPQAAEMLRRLVERKRTASMSSGSSRRNGMPAYPPTPRDTPPPILPRSLRMVRFLDVDMLEWARQLTILETRLFKSIQPFEFLNKAWSEKDSEKTAPNIRAMIRMTNQITGWVAETILSEGDVKRRYIVMKHFIQFAEVRAQLCCHCNFCNTARNVELSVITTP